MTNLSLASRGFTLLELLVALTIFALMGMASYSGVNRLIETRRILEPEFRRLNELTRAQLLLERDFLQFFDAPWRDTFGDLVNPFEATATEFQFVRHGWPSLTNEFTGELRRIRLVHRASELWREVALLQDREPPQWRSRRLLTGVTRFQLRYLDEDHQWQTEWPLTDASTLPRAVEIRCELIEGVELRRLWPLIPYPLKQIP